MFFLYFHALSELYYSADGEECKDGRETGLYRKGGLLALIWKREIVWIGHG